MLGKLSQLSKIAGRITFQSLLDMFKLKLDQYPVITELRLEGILDNLPRPPARKSKSTWPEMSTTEKPGNIADRGFDIFDEVFDVV